MVQLETDYKTNTGCGNIRINCRISCVLLIPFAGERR